MAPTCGPLGLHLRELLSIAHPENSPLLFRRVQLMTGKEFEEFTRVDVLNGIEAVAAKDNVQLIPTRFQGVETLLVEDIVADPIRFQYKEGVDSVGRQIGEFPGRGSILRLPGGLLARRGGAC